MTSDLIRPFHQAAEAGPDSLARLAGEGRRLIGYFCTYTPVELVHAAGFVPIRIAGQGEPTGQADLLTPSFICPYLRRAVEKGLNGEYRFLSGIVQGYTCEAACGVVNIWAENIGGQVIHTLPLPYNDVPAGREFFRSVALELAEKLNAAGGNFSMERLAESLELYAAIREKALEMYDLRYRGRLGLSADDFLAVIRSGFTLRPEEYLILLEGLLGKIRNREPDALPGRPVLVSGSLIEDPRVLKLLEESGGRVVADDLCSGWRNFFPPAGRGEDPLERLIDRYMRRAPCPARAKAEDRAPVLFDLMEKSGAQGVVFLLQKFCVPHLCDLPVITGMLKQRGVPALTVEMEETGLSEGQLRTRFQSFFEIMGQ